MPSRFSQVVGIVGNPTSPDVRWNDEQMRLLRHLGFNILQLSIAWAWKPANEVLNLEDLDDPAKLSEYRRRARLARDHGFQTLAHFGLPMGPQQDATTCILDPNVVDDYRRRLSDLLSAVPEIDHIMVYTYDQLAWLCSEFGPCPRCHGVPLHDRVAGFLDALNEAVQSRKPGVVFWWEPWELSEGQVCYAVERIRTRPFGLILHHMLSEVYMTGCPDQAFRNMARAAGRVGMPVIGECFLSGSGEDIHPLTHLAVPRLVWRQLASLADVPEVTGVKEYYGIATDHLSVNTAMLRAWLCRPSASCDELICDVASSYPEAARGPLLSAWRLTADAMEAFPWNASWALRRVFDTDERSTWQEVPTACWMTPAWQSGRRGFYLITDPAPQHPWLREDVGLRALLAARDFAAAAEALRQAEAVAGDRAGDIPRQRADVERAALVSQRVGQGLYGNRHLPVS